MEKILIQNGLTYDPLTKEKAVKDIAVEDGRITGAAGFSPDITIDASGCLVTPGLIDFHLHCFSEISDTAVNADAFCLPNGVTTCVDAGTAGTTNFETCYRNHICRSALSIKALLHVAPEGLTVSTHPENQTPRFWDRAAIRRLAAKYPGVIVGLKTRLSANITGPFGLKTEPLAEALELAAELGLPVSVHVNDPDGDTGAIAGLLRPKDVYCHVYAGKTENILNSAGRVKAEVIAARKRGVVFDACNGKNNFLFSVARPAIEQGFPPDMITTDASTLCSWKQPMISLPRLLSKYLALGMDLYDVLDAATLAPAKWLGDTGLASLQPGTAADIVLLKTVEKPHSYLDAQNARIEGRQILVPQLTIKNGAIVYCQADIL